DFKQKIQLFFKDLISNRCVKLSNSIDAFYVQSFPKFSIPTRYELYDHLITMTDEFNVNKTFNWKSEEISDSLNNFMETSRLFIDYLEKYSLISISGIKTINCKSNLIEKIEKIFDNFKQSYEQLERCSLKFVLNDDFKTDNDFKDEIFLTKQGENEIQIKYKTLIGNKIDYLTLKQDDDKVLFNLLNETNNQ
ncbi:unnamed protein product, partial [Didymodactylos carnosus]